MDTKEKESAAVWLDTDSLVPWERNPRDNTRAVAEVARSIKRFSFGAPIVARAADRRILAGHTRWLAARSLGLPQVPVRLLDLDPADSDLYALADNKTASLSTWRDDELGKILAELQAEDVDLLDGTGFSDEEIKRLIADDGTDGDVAPSDPPVPEPSQALLEKWQVERGQLWVAGNHRIGCGDCRDAADVTRLVGDRKINVAFTSPPYAAQRDYDEASGFKPIPPNEYVAWFYPVQLNIRNHLATGASWFVNIKEHCEDGQRVLYVKNLTLAHVCQWGWRFVDEFCWRNPMGGVPGAWPNRFKNSWEPVFHFTREKQIKFRPEAVSHEGTTFDYSPENSTSNSGSGLLGCNREKFHEGLARPSNVLDICSGGTRVTGSHPAEFPVELPEFFIRAFSDEGDVVFDPFLGAATTICAAERQKRAGLGMEISPRYVAVCLERLSQMGLEPRQE